MASTWLLVMVFILRAPLTKIQAKQIKQRHMNSDGGILKIGVRWTTYWALPDDLIALLSRRGYQQERACITLCSLWGWYSLSFILLVHWINLMRKVVTRELVRRCLISWGNKSWLSCVLRWSQTQTCETLGKAAAAFPLGVRTSEVRNHLIHPHRNTSIPRRVAWQWWDRHAGLPFLQ